MNDPKVEKQPPVPPFVLYCSTAIPQVFDDSLSYYETVCAMWKYLNDTVKVIDNNAEVVEVLSEAVKNLINDVIATTERLFEQAIASGEITAALSTTYDNVNESLTLSIVAEGGE